MSHALFLLISSSRYPFCPNNLTFDFITDLLAKFFKVTQLDLTSRTLYGFSNSQSYFEYVLYYLKNLKDTVSDQGVQLTSRVWAGFIEKLGTSVSLTFGYHIQAGPTRMWDNFSERTAERIKEAGPSFFSGPESPKPEHRFWCCCCLFHSLWIWFHTAFFFLDLGLFIGYAESL